MKTIATYGTFDLFHIGHLNLLTRAKKLGDKLIVFVSSDTFNTIKGKRSVIPDEDRYKIIASLKCVDEVYYEEDWKQKQTDIKKYNIDAIVMGDDWVGKFDGLDCEVIYLPRTIGISTTRLKEVLKNGNYTP